jgi:hypothetical protein
MKPIGAGREFVERALDGSLQALQALQARRAAGTPGAAA